MKKFLIIALFSCFSIGALCQSTSKSVIYLKNGSVINGKIIELVPGDFVKIRTKDQSIFIYRMDEVEKITSPDDISVQVGPTLNIRGGLIVSNYRFVLNGERSKDYSPIIGFNVGGAFDIPVSNRFSIETGTYLTTKGYDFSMNFWFADVRHTLSSTDRMYFAEIPVFLRHHVYLDGVILNFSFGPSLGIGLTGRANYTLRSDDGFSTSEKEKIKFGESNDGISQFDFSANAGMGIVVNSFTVNAFYSLGVSNTVAYVHQVDMKLKSRVFGVSLGYRFNL